MRIKTICVVLGVLTTFLLINEANGAAVLKTDRRISLPRATYGGAEIGAGVRVKRSTSEKEKEPEWDPYKSKGLTMKYLRAGWAYVKETVQSEAAKAVQRYDYVLSLWKSALNS